MHLRSRPLRSACLLAIIVILGGCIADSPTASTSRSVAPSVAPSSVASGAASAPAGSEPAGSVPPASAGTGSQTDTSWGRIWDALPAGFPTYPGSTLADDTSPEPVSATYAIAGGGDPAQIASWMQSALETATFSTESLSGPLEDGSYVLDSVGDGACRIQVVIAPMGGLTFVTLRYGAACPAA